MGSGRAVVEFQWLYSKKEDWITLALDNPCINRLGTDFNKFFHEIMKGEKSNGCLTEINPTPSFCRRFFVPVVCHKLKELDLYGFKRPCVVRILCKFLKNSDVYLRKLVLSNPLGPSMFLLDTSKL